MLRNEPFKFKIPKPGTIILHVYFYGITRPLRLVHKISDEQIHEKEENSQDVEVDFENLATLRDDGKSSGEKTSEEKDMLELVQQEQTEGDIVDEKDEDVHAESSSCTIS